MEPGSISSANQSVLLIGLDFGSTTSRAMIARAQLQRNTVNGRMELGSPELIYRSEAVLTPFREGALCADAIADCLEKWLDECPLDCRLLFAGGVIITGLAAEQQNASNIADIVRQRISHAIIATADDPCLESWLAFMGNSLEISRSEPESRVVNLDIGGGTTNPALAIDGNVIESGCYYIGARHFQFVPGSYQLTAMSAHGRKLAEHLGINAEPGKELSQLDIERLVHFYVSALESLVTGENSDLLDITCQVGFDIHSSATDSHDEVVITFSGGVGEILYQYIETGETPEQTCFGDLGVDLSLGIANSNILCRNVTTHRPEYGGRATVYGLTLHSAEISGNTLHMPRPEQLPLNDLPVVARIPIDAEEGIVARAVRLAYRSRQGACLRITVKDDEYPKLKELRGFGERFARSVEQTGYPKDRPLLLLVPKDFGKVIGNYASRWGKLAANLMVVDEVPDRQAGFVSLGQIRNFVIPVYYYGMR